MTIDEAAQSLAEKLNKSFAPGSFTVGVGSSDALHDENRPPDTIFVYEHVRGLAKLRLTSGNDYEGYRVVRKYVGRATPLIGGSDVRPIAPKTAVGQVELIAAKLHTAYEHAKLAKSEMLAGSEVSAGICLATLVAMLEDIKKGADQLYSEHCLATAGPSTVTEQPSQNDKGQTAVRTILHKAEEIIAIWRAEGRERADLVRELRQLLSEPAPNNP